MTAPLDLSDLSALREHSVSIAYRQAIEAMTSPDLARLYSILETLQLVVASEERSRAWKQDPRVYQRGWGVAA